MFTSGAAATAFTIVPRHVLGGAGVVPLTAPKNPVLRPNLAPPGGLICKMLRIVKTKGRDNEKN